MKARNWCFTLNNYTEDETNDLIIEKYKYMIIGYEIGENGTKHLQGFVIWNSPRHIGGLKKINKRIHWEVCKGSIDDNIKYCSKDGKYVELGERPNGQGYRADLKKIQMEIKDGKKVKDIRLEDPLIYHQYGRTLEKLEDDYRPSNRTGCKAYWIWGPTGSGKTNKAVEILKDIPFYVWTNDGNWWDNYENEPGVLMDDFRGEIKYNELLKLLDPNHCFGKVNRRNRSPVVFTSGTIVITSSLPPSKIYKNRMEEDNLDQLLRRLEVINLNNLGTEVVIGNTNAMTTFGTEVHCFEDLFNTTSFMESEVN